MKRPFGALLAVTLALAACVDGSGTATRPATQTTFPTSEVTPVDERWIALFDGSSAAGLRAYGGKSLPPNWAIENGELHAIPGPGVDLITEEAFADFELEFDWRVGPAGNSGVIYRVVESGAPSWTSGPEYQVLDDEAHGDGRDPRTSAAALYGLIAPNDDKRLEPVGSFNTGRIVVDDGHVGHWLNGSLVLEYDWGSPDVLSLVKASKFATEPAFMSADAGGVVLQHHGEEAWFRNVRIRELK